VQKQRLAEAVSRLDDVWLDETVKGMPADVGRIRAGDVGKQGWNLLAGDLSMPALTVTRSAIHNNIRAMQRHCSDRGVLLAPHGKTTMAPGLFKRQLEAGAWGLTAATVHQVAVYRRFGVGRIIMANEVSSEQDARRLGSLLQSDPFELYLWVDSVASVELLISASRAAGLLEPLNVFLEIGHMHGRTGLRNLSDIDTVVSAITASSGRLVLVGVSGYEGTLPTDRTVAAQQRIRDYLADFADAVDRLIQLDVLPESFLISAGGSAAFDHVLDALAGRWGDRATLILRSGCYVTHDHGKYAEVSPLRASEICGGKDRLALRPALIVWSNVISRPEAELALLSFGKRDAAQDYGLPTPLFEASGRSARPRELTGTIRRLHDHHAHLEIPETDPLRVGSRVGCGVSHPCTNFDRWRYVYEIDDNKEVLGVLKTFF
jgi:D-serine dehydratase